MQGTVKYSFLKEIKRRSISAQTLKNQVLQKFAYYIEHLVRKMKFGHRLHRATKR